MDAYIGSPFGPSLALWFEPDLVSKFFDFFRFSIVFRFFPISYHDNRFLKSKKDRLGIFSRISPAVLPEESVKDF